MKIKIYSTPTCATCKALKETLDSANIKYTDIDVSENAEAIDEMVRLSGQLSVPVIKINKKVVVGFNKKVLSLLNL